MGQRIKLRRKELKISQTELAELIDVSNNHMSNIENAKTKPSMDNFIKLCEVLNDHRLKAGGLFRAEAQTLRLKVALGAKAPSFPD